MISDKHAAPRLISPILERVVIILLSIWIGVIVTGRQLATLFASLDPNQARDTALAGAGVQLLALSPVLIPLTLFWPSNRKRFFVSLLLAHGFGLILSPILLVDPIANQLQAALLLLSGSLFLIVIRKWKLSSNLCRDGLPSKIASTESAVSDNLCGWNWVVWLLLLISLPWLVIGSLGSLLDTIIMLALAAVFACIFTALIRFSYPHTDPLAQGESRDGPWFQGLQNGLILLLISSAFAFPFGSIQLLLIILLPGLGWIISYWECIGWLSPTIHQASDPHKPLSLLMDPITWLIGGAAAFPLVFSDPDELQMLLGMENGEILGWIFLAALISALVIFGTNLLFWIHCLFRKPNLFTSPIFKVETQHSHVSRYIITIASLIFCAWVFIYLGEPGHHGETMLVIMSEQVDLSSIDMQADPIGRREAVYSQLTSFSIEKQSSLCSLLDRLQIPFQSYYLVNAVRVPQNPFLRLWLGLRSDVDRILDDPELRPLPEELPVREGIEPTLSTIPWNISAIQAERVWKELHVTGKGIIIGQSDSGAEWRHPELKDAYLGSEGEHSLTWYDPWNGSQEPTDISGHGTHTLATIVGKHTGVAPEAHWIACVNLARNLGNPSRYLDCMQFVFAPFPQGGNPSKDGKPSKGANILNNSWGCPEIEGCDSGVFQPALAALKSAGIFFVASAGNDGPLCGSLNVPPPIYREAFAVGAIDRYGKLAEFSSIGIESDENGSASKPDLIAPGVAVLSALPRASYGSLSGTSMAGPHVAGTVALMWSANPKLIGNIDLTLQILQETADPYTGPLPDCPGADNYPSTAVGYGVLNAYDVVRMALEIQ